jgi:hypothetical protein
MRWAEYVEGMGERRSSYKISGGKYKGRRPLGQSRHR